MAVLESVATSGSVGSEPIPLRLDQTPISPIGQPAAWFNLEKAGEALTIFPNRPLPRRCTIRPAALFEQARGFPEVNAVMGRLLFPNGTEVAQTYRAFTLDPQRKLRELFVPMEAGPDDDWSNSAARWSNFQAVARRLLSVAKVPWDGLAPRDVAELVEFVHWEEPFEGCVLHALTQWTHERGQCVIEVGSRRGRSLSMLGMALRGVDSDSLLFSVDPHMECPTNRDHARLAMRHIGEEDRLVQFSCHSDSAARLMGRGIASLIFIDGDHSYAQVLADFRNYVDLLAPGGCLLFHDYGFGNHNGLPEAHPDVRRAIDAEVLGHPKVTPLLLSHTLFALVKN